MYEDCLNQFGFWKRIRKQKYRWVWAAIRSFSLVKLWRLQVNSSHGELVTGAQKRDSELVTRANASIRLNIHSCIVIALAHPRLNSGGPFIPFHYTLSFPPFLLPAPHLHLTTSKVMVIVWRLRGNIILTVLYWQRATSSMGTVYRNSSHSLVGPWVCLCVFWVAWFIFMFMCVLFYLGQLSHSLSCFGAGVTNLNESPSSFCSLPIIAG